MLTLVRFEIINILYNSVAEPEPYHFGRARAVRDADPAPTAPVPKLIPVQNILFILKKLKKCYANFNVFLLRFLLFLPLDPDLGSKIRI
jgi:hypothetical protein